jgi:tetratricopeptide (TPR) repeat protein
MASVGTFGSVGCGVQRQKPAMSADALKRVTIQRVVLSEQQFAQAVVKLLNDGEQTPERLNLLVAVVQHQLGRAAWYFDAGQEDVGLTATMGALLLVRTGELRSEMFSGKERTLLAAAAAVSRRGREGQTRGFFDLVDPLLVPGSAKTDVAAHVAALKAWEADSAPGTMVAASQKQRSQAAHALITRDAESLENANVATVAWVTRALNVGGEQGAPMTHDEFDERNEAHRAVTIGAPVMAALYLRDGDAAAAVNALEGEPMSVISNPRLVARLADAADGDADAWGDLFSFYQSSKAAGELGLDPDVALAAAWGAALARHRADPTTMQSAVGLATLLAEHSMPDAALALLDPVLGKEPSAEELGWSLTLLLRSLDQAEGRGDLALVRQSYQNAARYVELAATARYSNGMRPGAIDVWQEMGGLESRAGYLEEAYPYLTRVAERSSNASVLRLLAGIQRHKGDLNGARESLSKMVKLANAASDPAGEAATQVMIYDLERERGQTQAAGLALQTALERVLGARSQARTGPQLAAVERVLADVLERYGEAEAANRAVGRAEDAARNDSVQLTATVLDAARRALCLSDLEAGRRALREALDGDLADADLTYAALWVKLLQLRVHAPSDGSVEEALARVDSAEGSWTSALRDWARGSLTREQLLGRASNPIQRVEAQFYTALSEHVEHASDQTLTKLKAVANSEAIELVEVRIAREFLLSAQGAQRPALPQGINLP